MNTSLRPATGADEVFLREMQYLALFVAPGEPPLPNAVVDEPGIARYYVGFGDRPGDLGRIAEIDGRPVGAAWVRNFTSDDPGYGFVDDDAPELAIAVLADRRGTGIGTSLLESLLSELDRVSLSVDRRNPARRLYERVGFVEWRRAGDSVVMLFARGR